MRYFIHLSFEGSRYSGWQRQPGSIKTVQGVIESALSKIFSKETPVTGCGRTDAGVHASQYVMHIDLNKTPDFDLKFRLNKNLPEDIAVFEITEVKENQHSRYDAVSRTYDYFIHLKKDPILVRYSSFYEGLSLDYENMDKVVKLISKTKDFRALCKQPDIYKNTLCTITNCQLVINDEAGRMRFSITSNRFLRGMIRYCVFYLLEVGTGKMTVKEFQDVLNQKDDFHEKQPALSNGLFLSKIEYPSIQLKNSSALSQMLKSGLEI